MQTENSSDRKTELIQPCIIRQKRALKRLKAADTDNLTVYIYGVTGIGKTELYRQYLKNRHYIVLNAGTMRHEELEIAVTLRRKTVVIDNLHELASQEEDEQLRQEIITLIQRPDIWLIMAGRCALPPWLTAERYREVFYIIDQSQLLFDEEMSRQYVEMAGITFTPEQMKAAIVNTTGVAITWPIVKDIYDKLVNEEGAEPVLNQQQFEQLTEETKSQMWDYLEYHVYDQWDMAIQEFLMEMSVVDEFTVQLAEMITGRVDVEPLLNRIKWLGNFMDVELTGDETVFCVRKEVQISMQRRLRRKFSKDKIRALYENAGLYYQLRKNPLKALRMYEVVGDTERIASLLTDNVRTAPNNGHYYELKKYYLALPEEMIKRSPELMCGMSMLQSLLLNTEESERWYRELERYTKSHSGSEKKAARNQLVYLSIALPHRGSDEMISIFKQVYVLLTDKQIRLREFSVTSNQASQMNGGKDFCAWSLRDRELAGSIGRIVEVVLGKYGKGLVNLALAESFFEKGEDNYEVSTLASKGRMQAESGGKTEQCFVGTGLLSWLYIMNGRAAEAIDLMKRFYQKASQEEAVWLLPNIETFEIRCALYMGDVERIENWMQKAPDEDQGFCIYDRFHYMTKVRIYLMQGRYEMAHNLLERLAYYAAVMKRTYIEMETELLLAVVQYRMEEPIWDQTLCSALSKIERYGFVRLISREGAAVWPLLRKTAWKPSAAEEKEKKKKSFWKQVLDETKHMAEFYPQYLQNGQEAVKLSPTMLEIVKLMAEGMSKEKIAEHLHMSVSNVKYHTQQMYRKLQVSGKAEAVREAGKRGFI